MRRLSTLGAMFCAVFWSSAVVAQQPEKDKKPQTEAEMMPAPHKPGEETRALLPIAIDARWTGKVFANAMKEGSPETPTQGKMDCSWTAGNLWLSCKLTDNWGKGKQAMSWQGLVTIGYDYMAKEYRATIVDNMGGAQMLNGKIDGNKLTLTSMTEQMVDGKLCKGRLTFDWTDPKAIKFTSENAKDGGEFKQVEEATLRPTKKEKLPGPAVS